MNIVRLQGGLGNQMFQYALVRSLRSRSAARTLLDDSVLRQTGRRADRTYALRPFKTEFAPSADEEIAGAISDHRVVCWLKEERPGFMPHVFQLEGQPLTIFDGFWQCERYFSAVAKELRAEFSLKEDVADSALRGHIRSGVSVCVHVRCEDYMTRAGAHLGFVGEAYYMRAEQVLAAHVAHAELFVFSDDLAWCRQHLRFGLAHTFVDAPADPGMAAHVLTLMSECKHFVIGNSTFAWWAAWLGTAAGKLVIAPAGWYANERPSASIAVCNNRHDSGDLIPANWIRI